MTFKKNNFEIIKKILTVLNAKACFNVNYVLLIGHRKQPLLLIMTHTPSLSLLAFNGLLKVMQFIDKHVTGGRLH